MTTRAVRAVDKFRDECGVFAVVNHPEASRLTYLGLYALQHRGQESAGMVTSDGHRLRKHRGMGYVSEIFNEQRLSELPGSSAIGHVRYSTSGESRGLNAQPILSKTWRGPLALAHNGNLLDTAKMRRELEKGGAIFQSTLDTEVLLHLLAKCSHLSMTEAIKQVFNQVQGAFSVVLQTIDSVWAVRDPFGVRPLCLGRVGDSWVVASETCAFDLIGAQHIRDVAPGEIICLNSSEPVSDTLQPAARRAHCIFEHVYFSRPDSRVFERPVHTSRYLMGRRLALEAPVEADLVVPVPDSGVTAALGYANQAEMPFQFGLIRNHYVGRTFIEPASSIRHLGVKVKLNPVRALLEGKRVVLIDDSIVRGTTSRKIVEIVRSVGAREVHLRVSSPPTVGPCHYGIATPTYEELIASNKSVEQIQAYVGADSLAYLSLEGLKDSVQAKQDFCSACFDRNYPIPLSTSRQAELFEREERSKPDGGRPAPIHQ